MTVGEFLESRLKRCLIYILLVIIFAVILLATGTQAGVLALLLITLALAAVLIQTLTYLRLRARCRELLAISDALDQKQLFTECIPPAEDPYERFLFGLMRRSGQAMIAGVSDAQAAQREYREYIESWVHEIKAPITAARLLGQGLDGDVRRRLAAELAQIEAHVERALYYARAESPERDCVIRRLELSRLVAQAVQTHRSLLIQSGVRVETNLPECTVYTDEKWAAFILGQLLQNAARYRSGTPVVSICAHPLGKQVQLSVSDNGIGIPQHELSRVSDRGFTGSNGRLRGGSTGMGLYLCRKISDFLGIQLEITSQEGEGTCVTLTFPMRQAVPEERD